MNIDWRKNNLANPKPARCLPPVANRSMNWRGGWPSSPMMKSFGCSHIIYVDAADARDQQQGGLYRTKDDGATWLQGERIAVPGQSLEEPTVVELKDGRVLMYIRTTAGPIFQCFSADQGVTWSTPEPSPLIHPTSPMQLRRIPSTGDLLCIWNNSATHRYPLTAAVSCDEGQTWEHHRDLEVETPGVSQYAYASLTFHEGRALMTYWMLDGTGLNLKFRSLPEQWFYEGE